MRYIPNIITTFRLIGAIVLCFIEPMSVPFFILYSFCGITDVLDGFIARTFHVTSSRGAWLDSIADLVFYGLMIILLFDVYIEIFPLVTWCAVVGIFAVRIISYLVVAIKYHRFAAIHTYANKLCGLSVFMAPYVFLLQCRLIIFNIEMVFAGYAAIEELLIHLIGKKYNPNIKTIFAMKNSKEENDNGVEVAREHA